jgi:glycosyltransferase involved in cell wall biosynthesis
MTLVFWQGIISIHQKTFLEAVAVQAAVTKVLLVVEQDISAYRKNMGWDAPPLKDVTIIQAPSNADIEKIVAENKDAIHAMGGIRVGPMLSYAFDLCAKAHCRIGIMTEPYNDAGIKGLLRTIKYRYYGIRYFKHIQFALAIGAQGATQYKKLGFDNSRIFPWAYFINVPLAARPHAAQDVKRIMYAGRLEAPKGIYRFTEELIKTGNGNYTLDIYGAGPDEGKLRQLISANELQDKIHIHPFMKYDDLLQQYGGYDWVVLPSAAKDGWGVIVSEGLLNGLKAICSNICGVSRVIKKDFNGVVFDWSKQDSCREAITTMLNSSQFADTDTIRHWAKEGLSAEAGADYFMDILDCVYHNKTKPAIPWE